MKKVQNAKEHGKALNELYRRYEHRGMTYDDGSNSAARRGSSESDNAYASKSYKISGRAADLRKYKNGVSGTGRHMTDKDFADYYKASREYAPKANVELESTILLQKIDKPKSKNKMNMKNDKNDIKKKLKAEADRNNPKGFSRKSETIVEKTTGAKASTTSAKIKSVAKEAVKTWVPIEERHQEQIVEGTKTKIPTGIILAILVITISLLMIVASAVLLGSAQREQSALKESIENLDFQISELNTELNKKNENIDIKFFAEEVLGMINQEHVNAEYINSNKTDGVIKQNTEKASLTSLINWILQNLR